MVQSTSSYQDEQGYLKSIFLLKSKQVSIFTSPRIIQKLCAKASPTMQPNMPPDPDIIPSHLILTSLQEITYGQSLSASKHDMFVSENVRSQEEQVSTRYLRTQISHVLVSHLIFYLVWDKMLLKLNSIDRNYRVIAVILVW